MAKKRFETVEGEKQPYSPMTAEIMKAAGSKTALGSGIIREVPAHPPRPEPTDHSEAVVSEPRPAPRLRAPESPLSKPEPVAAPIEKKGKQRNFQMVSRGQDRELDDFIRRLRDRTGTSVSLAIVIRAGLHSIMRSEEQLYHLLDKDPAPKQPATHDTARYAEFEDYWVESVSEAVRNRRPGQ